MLKVNGIETAAAGKSIRELVEEGGYRCDMIAVERNEEIVPKTQYDTTIAQDGDVIEIVQFMGGGR